MFDLLFVSRKRHVMLDAKCDHREKTKKTNDMYTNTVATADANINIARSHEVETMLLSLMSKIEILLNSIWYERISPTIFQLYGMMMFLTIIHTEYAAFVFIL
ncbi:hypothetical protein Bca52824_059621 [Brassica carinata]|uniref:Uncharacterized protein n=1 Tax=Brassica carinata TaxID=52824 RepID=A0A8X7UGV7_BRACI|nr:hypothetical protein Bca52824_059621 [Brassica carinata]